MNPGLQCEEGQQGDLLLFSGFFWGGGFVTGTAWTNHGEERPHTVLEERKGNATQFHFFCFSRTDIECVNFILFFTAACMGTFFFVSQRQAKCWILFPPIKGSLLMTLMTLLMDILCPPSERARDLCRGHVDPTLCPATGVTTQGSIERSRRVTLDWTGIFSSLDDPSLPSCCHLICQHWLPLPFWHFGCRQFGLTSFRAAGEEQWNCCSFGV